MTAKLHDHLSYPPRAMRAERAAAYLSISRSKFGQCACIGGYGQMGSLAAKQKDEP